jgi:hypothetical protein
VRQNPEGTLVDLTPVLSGSEAVYAFAGWLTTRPDPVIMSARDDAGEPAQLVDKFNKRQGLADPRPGWEEGIKPMGCGSKKASSKGKAVKSGKGKK